jgi:hypothetical protein
MLNQPITLNHTRHGSKRRPISPSPQLSGGSGEGDEGEGVQGSTLCVRAPSRWAARFQTPPSTPTAALGWLLGAAACRRALGRSAGGPAARHSGRVIAAGCPARTEQTGDLPRVGISVGVPWPGSHGGYTR